MKKPLLPLVFAVLPMNILVEQAAAWSPSSSKLIAPKFLTMPIAPRGTMPLDALPPLIRDISKIDGVHAAAAQAMAATLEARKLPEIQSQIKTLSGMGIQTLAQLEEYIDRRRTEKADPKELEPLEVLLEKMSYAAPLHSKGTRDISARFTTQMRRARTMADALVSYNAALELAAPTMGDQDAELVEAARRAVTVLTRHLYYIPPTSKPGIDIRREAYLAYIHLQELGEVARERMKTAKTKPQNLPLLDFKGFADPQESRGTEEQIQTLLKMPLTLSLFSIHRRVGPSSKIGMSLWNPDTNEPSTIERLIQNPGIFVFEGNGQESLKHAIGEMETPTLIFKNERRLIYQTTIKGDPRRVVQIRISYGRPDIEVAVVEIGIDRKIHDLFTLVAPLAMDEGPTS